MRDNLVLCYHALSPSWTADLSISPDRFEAHLDMLLQRGYRGVPFADLVSAPPQSRLLAITFDDAFRSVFTLAAPILRRLGMPGTLFVPTDYIESGGPLRWPGIAHWSDGPAARELAPMDWQEIQTLAQAGWEIGSHTASHPQLTKLDDAALADELRRSKHACEQHLGETCRSVAYPYGDVDGRVVAAARRAGYQAGAALPARLGSSDPLNWPRVGVYHADDSRRFALKISGPLRRLRASRAWDLISANP